MPDPNQEGPHLRKHRTSPVFWVFLCAIAQGICVSLGRGEDKGGFVGPGSGCGRSLVGREENCSAGGGGDMEAHFPNPPPPRLLGRRDGRGGSGRGCPTCRAGGGGVNPTSMAQNDTHVALIILTTQMGGGGRGIIGLLVEKTFSGQNLCFCAFGANIRS